MHRTRRTSRLFALMMATVALMATGCFKANFDITINDDGSGSLDYLVALDTGAFEQVFEGLGGLGDDLGEVPGEGEICDEFVTDLEAEDLPDNVSAEPYEDGSFCGVRVSGEFGPGDDAAANINDAFGADSPIQEGLVIEKLADGGWRFEATLENTDTTASATEEIPDFLLGDLFTSAEFIFEVTLPGTAVDGENNATSVDGGTFRWELDPLDPSGDLFAQTRPGGGGSGDGDSNLLVIGLIVGGLVVAAALAFWLLRRNSSGPSPAPIGAEGAAGPSAYAATSAPPLGAQPPPGAEPPVNPAPPTAPEPRWDADRAAWILDDPVRGRLIHDPTTNEWRPA